MRSSAAPSKATAFWLKCDGFFSNAVVHNESWVLCKGDTIRAIQAHAPRDDVPLAAESGYLVPLLADTHVHFYMDPWPLNPTQRTAPGARPLEQEIEGAIRRVRHALASGVGFLRDMGDPLGINVAVKKHFAERHDSAPELQVAGTGIHRPKKYGRYLGVMRDSVDEIKRTIEALVDHQDVDYIKLVTTGIVDFEQKTIRQTPQFATHELTELVEFAHAMNKKVAAHCSGSDGLEIAIDSGVDFIEHAYFITERQLQRLTANGLTWTPTFAPVYTQHVEVECDWSDDVRTNIKEILAEHSRMVRQAHQQGTALMAGTDAGCPGVEMGSGLRTELACMADAGIDARDLLHMATATNAQLCGASEYTGQIEVGQSASFALYEQPPWDDIRHLNTLAHVFHKGQLIEPATSIA